MKFNPLLPTLSVLKTEFFQCWPYYIVIRTVLSVTFKSCGDFSPQEQNCQVDNPSCVRNDMTPHSQIQDCNTEK